MKMLLKINWIQLRFLLELKLIWSCFTSAPTLAERFANCKHNVIWWTTGASPVTPTRSENKTHLMFWIFLNYFLG